MITNFEAILQTLSIHQTGNKLLDEKYKLSEQPFEINDDVLNKILIQYFLAPFEKTTEIYRLSHPSEDLNLNEVFHFAEIIFNDPETFHANSQQLAKHLYDASNHPKIKSGELYIAYFNKLQIEGELHDAIGIFKSETKETYLTVQNNNNNFELGYQQEAINIKKLDKGCVIFNSEKEEGYKVAVIDLTNRSTDAAYWVDDFLKLKVRNDNYNQTSATLSIYKDFVTKELETSFDLTKTDKIDLLNRSMKYFKENETFNMDEFAFEVINNEEGIQSFKNYKASYEQEYNTPIADSFAISNAAVKKQARTFKSVLKLDKNFHIYIHGDKELIEKGFDEEMNLNYYKVYFRVEN
ncbi:nucleoid-associated protein [Ferruginibacter sp.]|nr:nucleoid-associated protein [Ferruginibacter sp.]